MPSRAIVSCLPLGATEHIGCLGGHLPPRGTADAAWSTIESAATAARVSAGGNRARGAVVQDFLVELARSTNLLESLGERDIKIAVVGGSAYDSEVVALRHLGIQVHVETFGVDGADHWLDLNTPVKRQEATGHFDLVVCSQVLEHVWNHQAFFDHLYSLATPGAFLWLACPASNRPHGSPDFFSAGFTANYLARNVEHRGATVLAAGEVGSRRLYESALLSRTWLSYLGHAFPPAAYLDDKTRPWARRLLVTLYSLPQSIRLTLLSPRLHYTGRWATESWILARLPKSSDPSLGTSMTARGSF